MRTTRAYIASAGTAVVMLGAALVMLVTVSAFVAFGSWPGTTTASQIDPVLVRGVIHEKAKRVAVHSKTVASTRRTHATQHAVAIATRPSAARKIARVPAGTRVAEAPTKTASAPAAQAPATSTRPTSPTQKVTQPVRQVATNVGSATQQVGTQVGQQVQTVTDQVDQVVNQVTTGVQQTTQTTLTTVTNVAGSLLGH